jgi:uncharacterized membrane protein YfcA
MDALDMALLAGGGFAAGVINTLAGGGSLITVGLLVSLGLPGTIANGTNRIGVLAHNLTAAWRFRAEGISGFSRAAPVLAPTLLGSLIGAYAISRVTPELFERLFGALMLVLLIPLLRPHRAAANAPSDAESPTSAAPWSAFTRSLVFFGIGLYGGALQAGIGVFLVMALSRAGYDLVRANSIKVVLIAALTAVAIPVFIASRQVDWIAAAALAAGFVLGGVAGVRAAVLGGEPVIRVVLGLSVAALAGRMLGLV